MALRNSRGFTLIELVVVIATIGVLAIITVIGLTKYQADARDARRASSTSVISEALEKYYDQNGEYPSCSEVSAAAAVVSGTVLKGINVDALEAPQAPSGETNSIRCNGDSLTIQGVDFFQYVGDGSTACSGSVACLGYSLRYKDEGSGQIKALNSRRNTSIATSGAPTLSVADTDFDNITLQWTEVPNASSYLVQRDTSAGFSSPTEASVSSPDLTKVMGDLETASTYFFRVRPNATSSEGQWSNTVSGTTLNIAKPTCNAVANSNSQITVTWNNVPNATSYNFRYSLSSNMSGPQTTNTVTSPRVITNLDTGVTYYFQVMAVNSSFDSGWSTVCHATTYVPAPTSIAAVTDSATQITASWSNVSVATSYTLEYSLSSTFASGVTAIPNITSTSQPVSPLAQGKTYYFRVYALVSTTPSAASPTANATTTVNTPGAPSVGAYNPNAVRPYSAGGWVAWINSPASGNWYYTYGYASGSCPAGTTAVYSFIAQYSSPTTQYGWTSFSSDNARYMVKPNSPYKIKFFGRMRCNGSNAVSGISGYNYACASSSASNVACF